MRFHVVIYSRRENCYILYGVLMHLLFPSHSLPVCGYCSVSIALHHSSLLLTLCTHIHTLIYNVEILLETQRHSYCRDYLKIVNSEYNRHKYTCKNVMMHTDHITKENQWQNKKRRNWMQREPTLIQKLSSITRLGSLFCKAGPPRPQRNVIGTKNGSKQQGLQLLPMSAG